MPPICRAKPGAGYLARPCERSQSILRLPDSHSSQSSLLFRPLMNRSSTPGLLTTICQSSGATRFKLKVTRSFAFAMQAYRFDRQRRQTPAKGDVEAPQASNYRQPFRRAWPPWPTLPSGRPPRSSLTRDDEGEFPLAHHVSLWQLFCVSMNRCVFPRKRPGRTRAASDARDRHPAAGARAMKP
jgi:hypothetical protein